ncbi:MAG TPA: DUF6687 family protein [Drouetiella sp.]
MQYVPYEKSREVPHILVDGADNAGTKLVLSHWKDNLTPADLKDDLSAQIVFNYLDQPDFHVNVDAVTNDHFDADGLVGIWTLIHPEDAQEMRDFLIDIASVGDFNVYKNRDAARVSFALDAWMNPHLSPLKKSVLQLSYPELTVVLHEELLPRLAKIIEKVDFQEKFWHQQDALLEASEDGFKNKKFKLNELPELDLAIVTMPDSNVPIAESIHRMAIHNLTDCMRILIMQETHFELYLRYETWVDFKSRKLMPRVDLTELAANLTKQESMDGRWSFDDINSFAPALRLTGDTQSKIPFESFRSQAIEFLSQKT